MIKKGDKITIIDYSSFSSDEAVKASKLPFLTVSDVNKIKVYNIIGIDLICLINQQIYLLIQQII